METRIYGESEAITRKALTTVLPEKIGEDQFSFLFREVSSKKPVTRTLFSREELEHILTLGLHLLQPTAPEPPPE